MMTIERHRRDLAAKGIDPDCLPAEYWQKYDAKRTAWKAARRNGKPATAGGCKGCRIDVEAEAKKLREPEVAE